MGQEHGPLRQTHLFRSSHRSPGPLVAGSRGFVVAIISQYRRVSRVNTLVHAACMSALENKGTGKPLQQPQDVC